MTKSATFSEISQPNSLVLDNQEPTLPVELPQAAVRALEEARVRREASQNQTAAPREINGREGPDPARYGDWEKKGIAVDF